MGGRSDWACMASALLSLGSIDCDEPEDARLCCQEALQRLAEFDGYRVEGYAQCVLGQALVALGRCEEAEASAERAIAIQRVAGDWWYDTMVFRFAGELALRRERSKEAKEWLSLSTKLEERQPGTATGAVGLWPSTRLARKPI